MSLFLPSFLSKGACSISVFSLFKFEISSFPMPISFPFLYAITSALNFPNFRFTKTVYIYERSAIVKDDEQFGKDAST